MKTTLDAAWVLQRAGFYLLLSCSQNSKFSDVSAVQSPMDGGRAVKMMSDVAWVLHKAGSLTFDVRVEQIQRGQRGAVADRRRDAYHDDVRCSMGAT